MSVARSVAEVLRDHVVLEVEAIDRMYLNKPPSTNGINMKNSQHKNLIQLFHKAVDQGL